MTARVLAWWMVAFALLLATLPIAAQDRASLVANGHTLFTEHGCYGCHTVGKSGTPIGPDLSRVGWKYTEAYLIQWLRDPSSQKPTAHMPKLQLTEAEVQALVAYLASLR